jgi:hypothetical protein
LFSQNSEFFSKISKGEKKMENFSGRSQADLIALFDEYLVRDHSGNTWDGQDPDGFVKQWLSPAPGPVIIDNPLAGITQASRFTLGAGASTVYTELGLDGSQIGQRFLLDLQDFPMTTFFGNPVELLQGFARSENPDQYLETVTTVPASRFLNNVEKAFYLTHGYGRPNASISFKEMALRRIYKSAAPTSLIALSDIFQFCPSKQSAQAVREKLSTINLNSIGPAHQQAVERVSACCQAEQCQAGCLESFFRSIGMLSYAIYDPIEKIYVSNLSQLNLYSHVQPQKKWNFDDVVDHPNADITNYLETLPDEEIIRIETPNGAKLANYLTLDTVDDRLRSVLVRKAHSFLTVPRYFFSGDNTTQSRAAPLTMVYGRMVDSTLESWPSSDFLDYIEEYKVLLDPKGRPFSIDTAEALNQQLRSPVLQEVIDKTRIYNRNYFETVPENVRKTFASQCEVILSYPPNVDDIRTLLSRQPLQIQDLPLWVRQDSPWFVLAATLQDFAQETFPLNLDLILKSLQYYQKTFSQ